MLMLLKLFKALISSGKSGANKEGLTEMGKLHCGGEQKQMNFLIGCPPQGTKPQPQVVMEACISCIM